MNEAELIDAAVSTGSSTNCEDREGVYIYTFDSFQLEQFAQRIQPQWMPIESAPKGDIILLMAGDWFGIGFWQDPYWLSGVSNSIRGTAYCNFTVAFSVEPTHWMPLPKPPEGTP